MKAFEFTVEQAKQLDDNDKLSDFKHQFYFPKKNKKNVIYLCGNSLGLQPKKVSNYINEELQAWEAYGVEGHFKGKRPWLHYHTFFKESLSPIVGAQPNEVVVMNGLSVNLHLLLTSFYQPEGKRTKIVVEAGAFGSDYYVVKSQLKLHGLKPEEHLIEVFPPDENSFIPQESILSTLDKYADEIALVLFGGVNYYTGQVFDIKAITQKAHRVGAVAGFDLAHAAGNIELQLHDWQVDFAAWCSYKYLNAGPGATAAAFVHQKHHGKKNLPRLEGWWGHQLEGRFEMGKEFQAANDVDAWQLSNAPVMAMAPLLASLELFTQASWKAILQKATTMRAYLRYCIQEVLKDVPDTVAHCIEDKKNTLVGNQLTLWVKEEAIYKAIEEQSVILDWRSPNAIRIAIAPLYTSYRDIYEFSLLLAQSLKTV